VATIAPTSLQESLDVCRALGVAETLSRSSMLAYQDEIGAGMQPDVFKRFFWWEDESTHRMQERFGVTVEHPSSKALTARAATVADERLEATARRPNGSVSMPGLTATARADALIRRLEVVGQVLGLSVERI